MKQTRVLLSLLTVPVLLTAGCGSDDDEAASDTTDTTAATSESSASSDEAFIEEVNTLCAEAGTAMGEIFGPMASSEGPPSQEVMQSTYDALLEELASEQAEMEAMEPPADMQEDWDALVAASAEANAEVESQGMDYFDDEESNTFAEVEAMAVEMGFDACGGGSGG